MKKKYFTPEMEELDVEAFELLVGSDCTEDDCTGNVDPEPVPGCLTQTCDDF